MALVCVEPLTQAAQLQAEALAQEWQVPLRANYNGQGGVQVVVSELSLGLGFIDQERGKPYYVDFLSRAWKTRFKNGIAGRSIFRRALGVRGGDSLRVIDATAGFGQDSVLALCLGCEVIAVERSSVVVALLRNGITRAMREDELACALFEKLSVVEADAVDFLSQIEPPDVVYLDPMFDKPKKSAKSPKEMQLLQELLNPAPTATAEEQLFHRAFAVTKHRVVVKRPLKGRALVRAPNHSFKGQSIRYDVYMKA